MRYDWAFILFLAVEYNLFILINNIWRHIRWFDDVAYQLILFNYVHSSATNVLYMLIINLIVVLMITIFL